MELQHNRRITDVEITQLIYRVDKLEADFHKLEQTVEAQTNINLQAHNELVKGINEIRQELVMHTMAEEAKFDLIIFKLDKLVIDTAPAIAITTSGKYLTIAVKFIKDTIVPIIVGLGILWGISTKEFQIVPTRDIVVKQENTK